MLRLFIILAFNANPIFASSFLVPDSDTALLIQILGAEIEATAGILKTLDISSKTMKTIENAHFKTDDIYTKAMQAEHYANSIINFPKELEQVRSMTNLHRNIKRGDSLYQDRSSFDLSYRYLKKSNDYASQITKNNFKKNQVDRKLALRYLKDSGRARTTAQGAVIGARAAALSSLQMTKLTESVSLLNSQAIVQSDFNLEKERTKKLHEYRSKKNWGMIPLNTTFKEYLSEGKKGEQHARLSK